MLENAWSTWLFCPSLHRLLGLGKKDGESTLVSDTSDSLAGCFQGYVFPRIFPVLCKSLREGTPYYITS